MPTFHRWLLYINAVGYIITSCISLMMWAYGMATGFWFCCSLVCYFIAGWPLYPVRSFK